MSVKIYTRLLLGDGAYDLTDRRPAPADFSNQIASVLPGKSIHVSFVDDQATVTVTPDFTGTEEADLDNKVAQVRSDAASTPPTPPQRRDDGTFSRHARIRPGLGANAPTPAAAGVTLGYLMEVNDQVYVEEGFHPSLDRTKDITVFLSWAPSGSEAGKLVSWQMNVLGMKDGTIVSDAGTVITAVDEAVPDTVGAYTSSVFTVPASLYANGEFELHMRFSRIASSNDPVADPGIHHCSVVQPLVS